VTTGVENESCYHFLYAIGGLHQYSGY